MHNFDLLRRKLAIKPNKSFALNYIIYMVVMSNAVPTIHTLGYEIPKKKYLLVKYIDEQEARQS
jgi:predicted metal-dependent phosphoesterase TrpH